MKKMINLIISLVWLAVAFILIWIFWYSFKSGAMFGFSGNNLFKQENKRIFEDVTNAIIDKIDANLISVGLDITGDEDEKLQVNAIGSDKVLENLSVYVENETLFIKEVRKSGINLVAPKNESICVLLPKKFLEKNDFVIDAKNNSGSIKIRDCDLESLHAKNISGSIKVYESNVENFNAKNTSGSIKVYDSTIDTASADSVSGSVSLDGSFGDFSVENVSGSITVNSKSMFQKDSSAKSVSGSVSITIPENDGFGFEYKTASGNIKSSFSEEKLSKSGLSVYKDGGNTLNVKTTSGSIDIKKY